VASQVTTTTLSTSISSFKISGSKVEGRLHFRDEVFEAEVEEKEEDEEGNIGTNKMEIVGLLLDSKISSQEEIMVLVMELDVLLNLNTEEAALG
jgi:hypothetical protein